MTLAFDTKLGEPACYMFRRSSVIPIKRARAIGLIAPELSMGWVDPLAGLTHWFGWVGSTTAKVLKIWKDYFNAFKARLDKIWLQLNLILWPIWQVPETDQKEYWSDNVRRWQLVFGWVELGPTIFTCSGLGWVGSDSWWVGLDRVTQNGPMDNSGLLYSGPVISLRLRGPLHTDRKRCVQRSTTGAGGEGGVSWLVS